MRRSGTEICVFELMRTHDTGQPKFRNMCDFVPTNIVLTATHNVPDVGGIGIVAALMP